MSEHTAWNRGFDAGWYAALQHVPGQVSQSVPNPYPHIPEQPTTASVRCSNKEAHEPHWHVIRAEGITWAQGNCDGLKQDDKIARLSCRECLGDQHEACRDQRKCPCARADHPQVDAEIELARTELQRVTAEMEQTRVALREFMDTWGRR